MLTIEYSDSILKTIKKIKNQNEKDQIKKQIRKIINNPETGKPMRFGRKGTRELYMGSFRLAYSFLKKEKKIILLDLYHKDEQ